MAQLVGCHSVQQKVASGITGQGTCVYCRFNPHRGVQETTDQYSALGHFPFPLTLFLSKIQ